MRAMLLSLLIIIPFFSGIFSFFSYKLHKNVPRWIALIGIIFTLLVIIQILLETNNNFHEIRHYPDWNLQLIVPWIPRFGIEFNIAIDGFSIVMLIFSTLLSIIAVLCSWHEIKTNEGLFYLNFMLVITGVIGVFISLDLFLFFCFWEVMLLPMYFLITLWSDQIQKKKIFFSVNKFFIYGQTSGLILLSSILLLVFTYYNSNNVLTFNYNILITKPINQYIEYIVMIGFFLAFIIKMPIVPFHGWLPGTHVQSTYCGSVEIVGLLLKTAPYALIRYNLVLFPSSTKSFTYFAIFLGMISIFYGAWLAFSQTNIKRVIAYSSISHMGLILIAIYSYNKIALQGIVIQILSNSISTAALCIISGQLYKRFKTYNITKMGGFWGSTYWIPGFALFFCFANLGIPGTGNFIGEFLILLGLFQSVPIISILATTGIVFSSIYSLNMFQNIFHGPYKKNLTTVLINKQELSVVIMLTVMLIFLGINPQKIIDTSYNSINSIQKKFHGSISKMGS